VLVGMSVALATLYGLRLADVLTNWPYLLLSIATVGGAAMIAGITQPRAVELAAGLEAELADVPLEWRGIDRPWTQKDMEELDRQVGLSEAELHGVA